MGRIAIGDLSEKLLRNAHSALWSDVFLSYRGDGGGAAGLTLTFGRNSLAGTPTTDGFFAGSARTAP
jgi:hypothetical protein